ncbi:OmpA family protein [Parvularcula sp. LCG005]|uniref:OmpA family protein n=1 Tax=Parvularcula sp. LCG005 TaxID=3078805 RepID=UPI0029427EB3|nr:OmpA family protein [Parvularcula sp. LCG005]WOI53941.1 OmpA family protein [Parvularcula sp. LCG005]
MLMKVFAKSASIVALATLAACASTKKTDTTDDMATQTVEPRAEVVQPAGPVPGSMEDLEKNVGHRVFFGYNQYNLTNEAQAVLRRQAAWMKEYPEARVRLEGNCDERGTREYNLALGARRANAAKAYLVGLGIDPSRVSVISNGKERPIDNRSTPDAWAMNRNSTTILLSTVGA